MKKVGFLTVRKVAAGVIIVIVLAAVGFATYLWLAFGNVLDEDVKVSEDRRLLTDFDTSKFDRAVLRLEKRRNLEGPAEGINDPFGVLPP